MDMSNIMIYAGKALDKLDIVDSRFVQRYILQQPEVGVAVAIEKIDEALDLLRYAGFLDVYRNSSSGCCYQRSVPILGKSK